MINVFFLYKTWTFHKQTFTKNLHFSKDANILFLHKTKYTLSSKVNRLQVNQFITMAWTLLIESPDTWHEHS